MMEIRIAVCNGQKTIGITKDIVNKNLDKKAANVDIQTDLWFVFFDSSEIWIHNASAKESAIAIVKIPHITKIFDSLPKVSQIINHNVVITQDVAPKANPVLIAFFIFKKVM